jgi:hypothetical protein
MAEISVSSTLKVANGSYTYKRSHSFDATQSAARGGNPGVVNVGTDPEVISIGDLMTPRWAFFINLDADYYVDVGPEDGGMVPFLRILPGEGFPVPLYPGVSLAAQAQAEAATAGVDLLIEAMDM